MTVSLCHGADTLAWMSIKSPLYEATNETSLCCGDTRSTWEPNRPNLGGHAEYQAIEEHHVAAVLQDFVLCRRLTSCVLILQYYLKEG